MDDKLQTSQGQNQIYREEFNSITAIYYLLFGCKLNCEFTNLPLLTDLEAMLIILPSLLKKKWIVQDIYKHHLKLNMLCY